LPGLRRGQKQLLLDIADSAVSGAVWSGSAVDRDDRSRDHVEVVVQLERDHRLEVHVEERFLAEVPAVVEVELEGQGDEIGDRILRFPGQ
jgi:hypothetical protein